MKQSQIIEVLEMGGKIGGHSRFLFDSVGNVVTVNGKRVKISVAQIDKMIDAGLLSVDGQQYRLAR